MSPLVQNKTEKEVTLITCEEGATSRLVIKAKEVIEAKKDNFEMYSNPAPYEHGAPCLAGKGTFCVMRILSAHRKDMLLKKTYCSSLFSSL